MIPCFVYTCSMSLALLIFKFSDGDEADSFCRPCCRCLVLWVEECGRHISRNVMVTSTYFLSSSVSLYTPAISQLPHYHLSLSISSDSSNFFPEHASVWAQMIQEARLLLLHPIRTAVSMSWQSWQRSDCFGALLKELR